MDYRGICGNGEVSFRKQITFLCFPIGKSDRTHVNIPTVYNSRRSDMVLIMLMRTTSPVLH